MIDTGRISGLQFMFSVACYIQSSSLLTSFFASITKQDSWLVILFGFVACLPFLFVYIWLMQSFPDKNLIQINETVFGSLVGKIISALYIWFFMTLTSLNLLDLGDFVGKTIMLRTPKSVLIIVFMIVCAWAVYYGIEVIARFSTLFVFISLTVVIVSTFFTISLMNLDNFLPMFDMKIKDYIQGTNIIVTIPFGEIIAFLMITPQIKVNKKDLKKYLLWGFLIGGLTMLVVVLRDTAVLGNTLSFFALPSFETLRMVSITEALSRTEILFAIVLIILLFFKVSFLYYVSILALSKLLNLESYRPLIIVFGAFIITYANILYPSIVEHVESGREITPILWLLFEFLLPFATLVLAKFRKMPQKEATV